MNVSATFWYNKYIPHCCCYVPHETSVHVSFSVWDQPTHVFVALHTEHLKIVWLFISWFESKKDLHHKPFYTEKSLFCYISQTWVNWLRCQHFTERNIASTKQSECCLLILLLFIKKMKISFLVHMPKFFKNGWYSLSNYYAHTHTHASTHTHTSIGLVVGIQQWPTYISLQTRSVGV